MDAAEDSRGGEGEGDDMTQQDDLKHSKVTESELKELKVLEAKIKAGMKARKGKQRLTSEELDGIGHLAGIVHETPEAPGLAQLLHVLTEDE